MEKQKFVEITKVYEFTNDISNVNILMTNIKYHKHPTETSKAIVIKKFEDYFKLEKIFNQNYNGKRRNIQGFKIKILLADEKMILRENRKKLRTFGEEVIEIITDQKPKESLKYIMSLEKTKGKSIYLNIFFIDRLIYEKPKVKTVLKKEYINKNTLKKSRKSATNSILSEYKEEITVYFSNKLRFSLIHSSAFHFLELIEIIKSNIQKLEEQLFELKNYFYSFKKEAIKKKIIKGGNTYYINNQDCFWIDLNEEYQRRFIKSYNSFINTFNLHISEKDKLDIVKIQKELFIVKKSFFRNIQRYEEVMLSLQKEIITGNFIKQFKI